jgi:exosortase K
MTTGAGWALSSRSGARGRVARFGCLAIALALAGALKTFYSRASFEDLTWVLSPTRRLVEWLTGDAFEPEAGLGYLSRGRLFLIAPACAGVNFMIAAFVSVACGLMHTRASLRGCGLLLAGSALAAYGVTVLANATRIVVALRLHAADVAWGPFTAERIHCGAGVAIYLCFLYALFAVAARLTGANRALAL